MATNIKEKIEALINEIEAKLEHLNGQVEYLERANGYVNDAIEGLNTAENNYDQKTKDLNNAHDKLKELSAANEDLINKIEYIDFPERLTNIENSNKELSDYLEKNINQTLETVKNASDNIVKADFDKKFSQLNSLIDNSVKKNKEQVDAVLKLNLPQKIEKLSNDVIKQLHTLIENLTKLVNSGNNDILKRINEKNIPENFAKNYESINSVKKSVENLNEKLIHNHKELLDGINGLENYLLESIENLNTNQKTLNENLENKIISKLEEMDGNAKKRFSKQIIFHVITWTLLAASIVILSLNLI